MNAMTYVYIPELLTIVACLIASAILSAAETAITSLGTLKASHLVESGKSRTKPLLLWIHKPNHVLTTILLFNNAVNIGASAVAASVGAKVFGDTSLGIVTGIMTFLIVIFSEMLPKAFAKAHAETIAIITIRIILVLYYMLYPIINFMAMLAQKTVDAFREKGEEKPMITEDELEYLVEVSERTGVLETNKKNMISGIFEMEETKVREVMTPRTDMTAVDVKMSFDELLKIAADTGYSRLPVYQDKIDQIVGVILIKDLLAYASTKEPKAPFHINKFMRKPLFFPESRSLDEALKSLTKNKLHVAIVVDEYGGTAGIVTMEDILEVIVGEIQDETDEETEKIIDNRDGTFDVVGTIRFEDFLDYFEINPEDLGEALEGDIDTLNGWITKMTQTLPQLGQIITIGPLKAEVINVHRHRVERLRVSHILPEPPTPSQVGSIT